jgi:hypothetical protein
MSTPRYIIKQDSVTIYDDYPVADVTINVTAAANTVIEVEPFFPECELILVKGELAGNVNAHLSGTIKRC